MYICLIVLLSFLLNSCSVTHHHHHYDDDNKYVEYEVLNHSYVDKSDHIVVIIKHKHRLKRHQKKRLKRWCHNHYRHHNKKIKYKFILN